MVTTEEPDNQDILELRSRKVNKKVCRALWDVNHEEIQRDLDNEQRSMAENFTAKYNFNVQGGYPISGHYEWEQVASRIGSLQARPVARHKGKKRRGKTTVKTKVIKSKTAKKDTSLVRSSQKVNKTKTDGTKAVKRRSKRFKSGTLNTALGQQV